MSGLEMAEFLESVRLYGMQAEEVLIARGHPAKVVMAKAEKASRKRYTDYGTIATRCWLTLKGESFLRHGEASDN